MILTQLEKFRQAIYDSLGKAKDAVFELMDAILTSPSIPSFVSLSQSPVFRRQWSSIYAALDDSRPPKMKLNLSALLMLETQIEIKNKSPKLYIDYYSLYRSLYFISSGKITCKESYGNQIQHRESGIILRSHNFKKASENRGR